MIRLILLAVFIPVTAAAADIKLRIYGGIPSTGQALVALFASEADWMKTPKAEQNTPIDGNGEAKLAFSNIKPGAYGISVIYDENADGKLDLNLIGIPTEGFGFSNDARASFGPPKWGKTRFKVTDGKTSISIRLDRAD